MQNRASEAALSNFIRLVSQRQRRGRACALRVRSVGASEHRSIEASEPTRRGREKERAAHSAHVTVHRRQKTLSAVITKTKPKHCVDIPKALHHQLECLHLDEPLSSAGPNEASTNSKASRRVALAEARVNCDSRAVVFSSVFSTYTSAAFAQQLRGYGTWKRRTQPRPRHAFASPPLSRQRDSGHDLRSPNRRLGTATTKVGMQLTRNSLFSMRPARSFGDVGLAPSGAVRPRLRLRATKVRLSGSSLAAWVRDEGLRATPVGSARLGSTAAAAAATRARAPRALRHHPLRDGDSGARDRRFPLHFSPDSSPLAPRVPPSFFAMCLVSGEQAANEPT